MEKERVWMKKSENNQPEFVKMSEMDNAYLQKAYYTAQNSLKKHHDITMTFVDLIESLEAEAQIRGVQLKYPDENSYKEETFFKAQRMSKKVLSNDIFQLT